MFIEHKRESLCFASREWAQQLIDAIYTVQKIVSLIST